MRILFVSSSKDIHEGSSRALIQILNGLIPLGIKPYIILAHKNSLYDYFIENKIECSVLNHKYRMSVYPIEKSIKGKILFIPRLLGRLLVNSLAALDLIKITKEFKPDIIHSNDSGTAIGFYVARHLRIPHVWHIREYADLDFNWHYYPTRKVQQLRYTQHLSYTISITKDIQQHHHANKLPTSKVIYDGVLPESSVTYTPNKKAYILYAGRLQKAKGILPLIDAYAMYCKQHPSPLPLYVAGSGIADYTQLVKDKISQYGINKNVILLGMRDDILSLYTEAKALVVPSLSEGFGFITAEAMFSGCLVIGRDTAGTKEQFDNGKTITGKEIGLRYNTQEELVQHLIDVTNNSIEHYESMIQRSQKVVKQLYATEQTTKQIYDFYKDIIIQK